MKLNPELEEKLKAKAFEYLKNGRAWDVEAYPCSCALDERAD
jgi:hypothetical protein